MRYSRFGLFTRSLVGTLACTLTLAVGCEPVEELEPRKSEDPIALGEKKDEVVFGTDDRQDVYAHPDATLRALARQATVALMRAEDFDATDPNNVTLLGPTLGEYQNLCATERFRDDPTAAGCTGTLIDDDLVLTAGHCLRTDTQCAKTKFVFNYYRTDEGVMQTLTTEDIFGCAEIVASKLGIYDGKQLDHTVVRLDRPATPRFTPAPVRKSTTALSLGQNVAVIGSGSGIPFKIDSGGSVTDPGEDGTYRFNATTDTFGGNSGSAVYETNDYTVAGILVSGREWDYIENGSCNVVNTCSETGCYAEGSIYVYPALQHLCAVTHNASQRLCTGLP
ncbi:trypsin-like serine peptidase [Cystobacter fuscus]|uniref:trypsin-like serine peptidase n=1 Tax=Cystobacter fuscus TaxID=43 RepID=UPI002B2C7122|nr:trypsin-like peptidase domain-containing protein [Cystobacter fuscus]